jgi:PAS domain-containing protein
MNCLNPYLIYALKCLQPGLQMKSNSHMTDRLFKVRGTELVADDTRERYREKIARITLDSMVQFVGLLDAQGTVLEINQVALDALGIKLAGVEGKPFWDTFWWQVSEEVNAILRESIERAAQGDFVRWDTPTGQHAARFLAYRGRAH